MKYDKLAQAAEYKPNLTTGATMSATAGLLFYSEPGTAAGPATASLGQLVYKNAMVCREKAMLTHLYLAHLGVPTIYQPGSVKVGEEEVDGHCWVEWIEPATGRNRVVEAVIDGTWGKVYTNYSYDDLVALKLEAKIYFKPMEEQSDSDIGSARVDRAETDCQLLDGGWARAPRRFSPTGKLDIPIVPAANAA